MDFAAIASIAIFLTTFVLILTERVHRTVIALFGAVSMVTVGTIFGFYYPIDALMVVSFNTIILLFGMMLIVVVLEKTGFFQYLGIWTAKKTGGNPWYLMLSLGLLTAVLSMILDNVTTIILIAPITIVICRMLGLNPAPILLAEALLSNTGGAATLVGDPPNIMIGSAAPFAFNDFLIFSLPVSALAIAATLFVFRFIFKEDIMKKPENVDALLAMDEREAITDYPTLYKALAVLGGVVVLFLLHGALHLEAALIAVAGAALLLLLVSATKDPQHILEKVELSVLLFFVALFVTVGGLEHAGVLEHIAQWIASGAADNILLTAIIILWVSAITSAIVDNIPLTVAMIPIILSLEAQGVPVELLWWALVFGVGFGGNGSPIGSTAGVIAVTKSEQTANPITLKLWLKAGTAATLVGLVIATGALYTYHTFDLLPDREPRAAQMEVDKMH